eukprot:TRINITY_DN5594_c0_g2_i7.p1 TRINITY_DN5594_c0_g2~~TRINITY_DN5594_c0_g2_i7.p1  ORF type:complete len:262 (-),score=51.43 TRINITY_DN5594_c0_g2_i7:51-836(-)
MSTSPLLPIPPASSSGINAEYGELSPVDVARRLSVMEFDIFKLVRPSEFHKEAWTKKPENARNIRGMIDRFNAITKWVVHCIVTPSKIRIRAKRYKFFIKVAEQLKLMNNFHTLMAVISGINEGPVFRLNHTREEVGKVDMSLYDGFQTLMSADRSYITYRGELTKAMSATPGIPYIGVHLRDCIYMGDGLYEGGIINCKKVAGLWGIIHQIQVFQSCPYSYEPNDKLDSILLNLHSYSMNDLFEISRTNEPKNSNRADIS